MCGQQESEQFNGELENLKINLENVGEGGAGYWIIFCIEMTLKMFSCTRLEKFEIHIFGVKCFSLNKRIIKIIKVLSWNF